MSFVALTAVQLNSQADIDHNLASIRQLLCGLPAAPNHLVVLPENAFCFGPNAAQQAAARFDDVAAQLADMARDFGVHLVAGTLPCPHRPDGTRVPAGRLRAACLMLAPDGTLLGRYDKIHLFDVQVGDAVGAYRESDTYEAGTQPVCVATPWGRVGLMVCYDVRFARLALTLREQGADVLTVPAAFTHRTGALHWSLLLRARAVDTQCAVVGSAQTGWHGDRQTWGHSMVVAASGQILAEHGDDGAGLAHAVWPAADQAAARQAMPLMQHQRVFLHAHS